ncbi:GNAT family N-acetyltransferase [Ferrimonas balearica]|uniref:GNAT family N-acetyltransferase n=1 Tax=Ferrimonas balearica TaxID=44012 RepID=UPI001C9A0B46|nr:GNAT family N-acetyltransferase [Ferrimonas balearica]MBY5993266.1 GNAT family N-acetyltransferase [Ferrimonas balearica]
MAPARPNREWCRGSYRISTDPQRLDRDAIHRFLSQEAYWCLGIPRRTLDTALDHSLCFGLYQDQHQVGFARLITDHATFAYLADVYLLPAHRGQGLARWLIQCVLAYPGVASLRRLLLVTKDAHGLYRPHGFAPPAQPAHLLTRHRPDAYR